MGCGHVLLNTVLKYLEGILPAYGDYRQIYRLWNIQQAGVVLHTHLFYLRDGLRVYLHGIELALEIGVGAKPLKEARIPHNSQNLGAAVCWL